MKTRNKIVSAWLVLAVATVALSVSLGAAAADQSAQLQAPQVSAKRASVVMLDDLPIVLGAKGPAPKVRYDFTAGDTLVAKNGWAFANPNWQLSSVPNGSGMALPFSYGAALPGNYAQSEMRFTMPHADQFWIRLRWHVPLNYLHRHDTHLDIVGAPAAGWQLGDIVRGTDGVSQGVISKVDASGVFLRFANKSAYDSVWKGSVTNLTRNSTLSSTGRGQWGANNKLLAMWADAYSGDGKGSTIVWQTDSDWYDGTKNSTITVGYSIGGNTGTSSSGGVAGGGILITPADYGKYMDLIFHGRFSSAPGAKDGVIRTFVRKQGEAKYAMRHNIINADMNKRSDVAAGLQQWQAGYLMGWSNSGYDAQTTFHISQLDYFDSMPAVLNGVSP
ncbi:MAG: hypothetical protein V4805_07095 [Pseudomonadota bacterium]